MVGPHGSSKTNTLRTIQPFEPTRSRTWNLLIRSQTRCPLRHRPVIASSPVCHCNYRKSNFRPIGQQCTSRTSKLGAVCSVKVGRRTSRLGNCQLMNPLKSKKKKNNYEILKCYLTSLNSFGLQ